MPRKAVAGFADTMSALCGDAEMCRRTQDWLALSGDAAEPAKVVEIGREFLKRRNAMRETLRRARKLLRVAPGSDGARVLREMVEMGEMDRALRPAYAQHVRRLVRTLARTAKATDGNGK
jgi:hypothetical protein